MGLGIYRFGEKFLSNKMRLGLLALAVILVLAGGFIISAKSGVGGGRKEFQRPGSQKDSPGCPGFYGHRAGAG